MRSVPVQAEMYFISSYCRYSFPPNITSTNNEMTVTFKSNNLDYTTTSHGFLASYISLPPIGKAYNTQILIYIYESIMLSVFASNIVFIFLIMDSDNLCNCLILVIVCLCEHF